VKDADNHNAALLAKEAAESRARLQGLTNSGGREARASRIGGGDIRRRQLGDIAAILGGRSSKRRKPDDPKRNDKESRHVNSSGVGEEPERGIEAHKTRERKFRDEDREDRGRSRSHRKRGESSEETEEHQDYSSYRRSQRSISYDREGDREHRKRHRSTSRDRRRHRDGHKERASRSRSRSPREHRHRESKHHHRSSKRRRSRSPEPDREKSYRSHRHRQRSPSVEDGYPEMNEKISRRPDYDSDPLDEIIGPQPAPAPQVRSRGRGTLSLGSGIDARFAATYDPSVDVQLDPDEENDWDQALEALRDRQKWKQQGADRLRAAGFTEDEIRKWEKGGEKTDQDVKWARRGEGREWDRGKVVDDDGIVTVDPGWGRLKGT
jgi:hypothetical protein